MPDNIEQIIERTIKVYLTQEGAQDVAAGMKSVKKEIDAVRKAAKDLGNQTVDLNKEMKQSAKNYARNEKAASKALKVQQRQVAKTIKSWMGLGGAVKSTFGQIGAGLKQIATGGGLGKIIDTTIKFDKSLLSLAASTHRLGIGISQLEKKITSLASASTLTRTETMALFAEFNKTAKFVSMRDFEGLLVRIQGMVGANKEAIGEYMGAVSGLSQEYTGLAQQISKLDDVTSAADKASIESKLQSLLLIGKISDAEYRSLTAVVRGAQYQSKADREQQAAAQARIKAIQEYKRLMESIQIGLGRTILPIIEKLTSWMSKLTDGTESWGKAVAMAAAAYASIKIGGMVAGSAMSGLANVAAAKITGTKPTTMSGNLMGAMGPGLKKLGTRALPGLRKFGPGAIAMGLGSYGLGKLSEKYESVGAEKTGAGLGLGSSALKVGGAAMTGAMVGSMVPVIGTAIGGAVGGLVGVISEWDNITSDLSTLIQDSALSEFAKSIKESKFGQVVSNAAKSWWKNTKDRNYN